METGFMNKITGLVIALVVGGLLVGGLLIPTVQGMTATEKTFTNSGIITMEKITTSDTVTASWDYTNPYVFTVNDVDIDLPQALSAYSLTVSGSDNEFMLRYIPNDPTYGTYLTVFNASDPLIISSVNDGTNFTMTIENGEISVSNGTDTNTSTFSDHMYITSNTGEFVMKAASDKSYVLDESNIYAIGRSWLTNFGANVNFELDGNLKDGFTVDYFGTASTLTISNIAATSTQVNGFVNLYQFEKVTFTTTSNDDKVDNLTYNQVIVPKTVTAELSQHMSPTEIAMFGVISILGIVALVVVAANGIRNKY